MSSQHIDTSARLGLRLQTERPGNLIDLPVEHLEIHEGNSYIASTAFSLAGAASGSVVIQTPDSDTWAHMIFEINAEGASEARIYETVATTGAGTSMPCINRQRNSSNTSVLTVAHTPTAYSVVGSTLIVDKRAGSGGPYTAASTSIQSRGEIVLKRNTTYLVLVINNDASPRYINVLLDWYERAFEQ